MDYTRLSLAEVKSALLGVARDTQSTFGGLDASQLNWRPDAKRWSVGQCFEHLYTANGLMLVAAQTALRSPPPSVMRRMLLPGVVGGLMIRSQAPETTRKYTAPRTARPTTSEIPQDILQRFIDQQRETAAWAGTLDASDVAQRIMVSPFIRIVTYSILDGFRLWVAHDHRHFQQAQRVMLASDFPKS